MLRTRLRTVFLDAILFAIYMFDKYPNAISDCLKSRQLNINLKSLQRDVITNLIVIIQTSKGVTFKP